MLDARTPAPPPERTGEMGTQQGGPIAAHYTIHIGSNHKR